MAHISPSHAQLEQFISKIFIRLTLETKESTPAAYLMRQDQLWMCMWDYTAVTLVVSSCCNTKNVLAITNVMEAIVGVSVCSLTDDIN